MFQWRMRNTENVKMANDIRLQEFKYMIQQGRAESYPDLECYCWDSAKSGNIDALILIGDYLGYNQGDAKPLMIYCYNLMQEVAKVLPQAYYYLHRMIEQNNFLRILEPALSITTEKLEQLSKEYLERSADSQFPWAMSDLGNYLITGLCGYGMQINITEGLNWLNRAAKKNHAPAMSSLGYYYDSIHDDIKATYWFARAAILLDEHGIKMLALAFRDGKGVSKNKQIYIYLEKIVSSHKKDSNAFNCKPKCFDTELDKILQLNF